MSQTTSNTSALEAELKQLRQENAAYKKLVNSKRFQYADKLANSFNRLFPASSRRGKATRKALSVFTTREQKASKKRIKLLQAAISAQQDIIVLHSISWNTPLKQRPHHLARCLADQGFFVIYLEAEEGFARLRKITDRIYVSNSEEEILALTASPDKDFYFFFNNVANLSLEQVQAFKKHGYKLVYEYIDEFHEDIAGPLTNQLDIWNHLHELHPRLVLASATKLYDDARQHLGNKQAIILSKNAVNVADFDYHQFQDNPPKTIAKIIGSTKPIVGYYGAIAPWLDYNLIHSAAQAHPEYEFVFIGVNYQDGLSLLNQTIKNLHYLGPKDYKDLPALAAQFSCAIIPFSTGEIAKGTSPVKLYEYMAAGLPTVVTRDLEECKGYDYVHVAKNSKEFSALLPQAITEINTPACRERLLAQANDNSWSKRAEDIAKALHKS